MKLPLVLLLLLTTGCYQVQSDLCIDTPVETVCFSPEEMEATVDMDLCINEGDTQSCWPTDSEHVRKLNVYFMYSDDLTLQGQFITGLYYACLRNYDEVTCGFYKVLIP